MHLPQSYQTMQELRTLAAVPTQIMSPRDSSPIVSIVQDIASGVYRLTKSHVRMTERQAFNALASIYPRVKGIDVGPVWTGRQLLSAILPAGINLRGPNKFFDERKTDDRDNFVIIEGGEIKQGTVDKSVYQARSKGLVHMTYNDYSPEQTRNLFDATQQLICNWLVSYGFSTGISDLVVDATTQGKFGEKIAEMKAQVAEFIARVHRGELDNRSTKTDAEFFEDEVNTLLNRAATAVGDLGTAQVDDRTNRMINMIKSGAKGNPINFAQMIGCLGQQNVDGSRIPYGFDDRTLPHFTRYDDGPAARGFVENSFISGLSPQEFFFHAMGGREGLIDTAVKSVTGDTPVVVLEGGVPKYVRIGDWIDTHLDANKDNVKYYPADRNMELLELSDNVLIPTVDEHGVVTWGSVLNVTRHDPSDTLYRVETATGRSVTVTAGQSLLVWCGEEKKIKEVASPDLRIGDALPVTLDLPTPVTTSSTDLSSGTQDGQLLTSVLSVSQAEALLQSALVKDNGYIYCMVTACLTGDVYMAPSRSCAELLAMLCSRVGIFAKLDGANVHLLDPRCYNSVNNVVLDPVVEIVALQDHGITKVYDLTIPSTLNFGLANGLQVRDTSSTGYIQRQLVKAMEDCKVYTDRTVRNATGAVVQFLYGEDGMDAIKIEGQGVPYVDMNLAELADEYLVRNRSCFEAVLTDEVMQRLRAAGAGFEDDCSRLFRQIIDDREFLITRVHRGDANGAISYPVHFQRIITNVRNTYANAGGQVLLDLSPVYVLETLDRLCRSLYVTKANAGNRFMQILLRAHLAPKRVLLRHRLCRAAFDLVVQQVVARFYEAFAHPGDMVGVVAAQSIGEPATQLSAISSTRILVKYGDRELMYDGPIGAFIDEIIESNKVRVKDLGGDSVVLPLRKGKDDFYIIGVGNDEKTSWHRISEVSRHPANGGMVRIYTKSGKTTCATLSHSFLKRTVNGVAPVLGSDLKVGDRVPVAKYIPTVEGSMTHAWIDDTRYELTKGLGWLCGAYLADGAMNGSTVNISKVIPEYQAKLDTLCKKLFNVDVLRRTKKGQGTLHGWDMSKYNGTDNLIRHKQLADWLGNEFGRGSFNKRVPAWVYASNLDFIRGVLGGYFDGDGNVNDMLGKQMIRTASVSEQLTDDIILLLAYTGIFASKCRETHKKEQGRTDLFTAQVSRKYAQRFKDEIGLVVNEKARALDNIIAYCNSADERHNVREEIDMVPELGSVLAHIGQALQLEGQSRTYGRFAKKEAIGRQTLTKYIGEFEEGLAKREAELANFQAVYGARVARMRSAAGAAKVVGAKYVNFQDELADLGQELARLANEAKRRTPYMQYAKMARIGVDTLVRYTDELEVASQELAAERRAALDSVPLGLDVLRQAANSDVVWDEIVRLEYLDDPKEYVYDFTVPGNDSFMVDVGILVHNTLNSVEYHTDLLVKVDGELKKVKIGEFIDAQVDAAAAHAAEQAGDKGLLEQHPNDTWLAHIKNSDVQVLSCDEAGKVGWRRVEAVTKHPVVNRDGSDTLLKVTTRSGREVIATKAKSFLKRVNNKVLPVDGEDLHVGDRLPVSRVLPVDEVTHLELAKYLPKTEYLYTSEVAKALKRVKEFAWWKKYHGTEFVLPYSRSDTFVDTFVNGNVKQEYAPNCVYPKNTNRVPSRIPERIPLDEDFGFFVGAYLAEGHAIKHAVLIANVDEAYLGRIEAFCKRYDLGYHTKTRKINNGTSTTLRITSTVLGTLMREHFGELSQHKRMPVELLAAPEPFLRELVNAYFSGDGSVSKKYAEIKADSTSYTLLETMQQVLLRFDIICGIHRHDNKQTCFKSDIQQAYTLLITSGNARRFAERFKLVLVDKQHRLDKVLEDHEAHYTYGREDKVPDVVLSTGILPLLHRNKVTELLLETDSDTDRAVLAGVLHEQVLWDEVVSIEEVRSEHSYVYDLTVEGTRNFNIYSGLCMRDTFHSAGISSASKAVRGVPRLQELLSVSKAIKTPAMTIRLNPAYRRDARSKEEYKSRCLGVLNELRTVRFRDVVKASRIYFDPEDFNTRVPEDRGFLDMYRRFLELEGGVDARSVSPWLLRLELDAAKMLEMGLHMADAHAVLADFYGDRVECMFSDDNSNNLVLRVKQVVEGAEDPDDLLTELKALEHNILETVPLRGVARIEKVSMREVKRKAYNPATGTFDQVAEWVIDTDGSNLRAVLGSRHVDAVRTTTNNVYEIYETLGIEAAKAALYNEIVDVLSGINVNYRHLSLLIDTMTNKGVLMPINRHGINRGDAGPLAKCSFEEVTDMLVSAGVFAEVDRVNGVSANVMLGQVAPCGTGDSEVLLDEGVLADNAQRFTRRQHLLPQQHDDNLVDEDVGALCAQPALAFSFELPAAMQAVLPAAAPTVRFV